MQLTNGNIPNECVGLKRVAREENKHCVAQLLYEQAC